MRANFTGVLGARRTLACAAVAAALVVAAGCGDDDDDASSSTTEASDDGGAAVDAEQAVVDAYEGYWQALIAAGDPADPEAPGLAEHATGDALATTRSFLGQLQAEGVVVRGTYEFDARAAEVGDDRAVVEDCGLDLMEAVVAATGEVVEPHDEERDGVVAELVLEDGTWKVTSVRDDEAVCA